MPKYLIIELEDDQNFYLSNDLTAEHVRKCWAGEIGVVRLSDMYELIGENIEDWEEIQIR